MRTRLHCLALGALVFGACAEADLPGGTGPGSSPARAVLPKLDWREVPSLERQSSRPVIALWDRTRSRPRMIHGRFSTGGPDAVGAARTFLEAHRASFRLPGALDDFDLTTVREGLAGTYIRFQQTHRGMAVFGREVVVLVAPADHGFDVLAVNLGHVEDAAAPEPSSDIGPEEAEAVAMDAVGLVADATTVERGVLSAPSGTRLAYRVRLSSTSPHRAFLVDVDAETGAPLEVHDLFRHATGSGFVFDPNPVGSSGDTSLVDNNDQTSAALDAEREMVSLPNLDGSGFLRGSWVDARRPGQRAQSAGLTFAFDRSDDRFEEVMAYYHIDRAQERIQALGFTGARSMVARPIETVVDASNQDNSYFSGGSIFYGSGGVDDAEDGDLLLHEYGHAIQDDVVPDFGFGGDAAAMGEGFGDYVAASFQRALSGQAFDPACIAEWDATSYSSDDPPCLRRVDGPKHYPEDEADEPHDDGEMWSAALFGAENQAGVGADVMNTVTLESHFMLTASATFEEASFAVVMADGNLFGGAHGAVIRRRLVWQGVSRALTAPPALPDVVSSEAVSIDNVRTANEYPADADDVQTFTSPGAQGLRVHFTRIETETDPSCFEEACDSVYLYDAPGDLFQILSGDQTDVMSVQIPGDTVQIRLVSDYDIGLFGYHVDRIDVLGGGAAGGGSANGGSSDGGASNGGSSEGGAGASTSNGAASSDGGSTNEGGGTADGSDESDDDGCGCHVPARQGGPSTIVAGLLLAGAALRRRTPRKGRGSP